MVTLSSKSADAPRKQKAEHRRDPPRPARFLVGSIGYVLEMERVAGDPAIGLEPAGQYFGIAEGALPLALAHVEPHPGPLPDLRGSFVQVAQNALVVPPHTGRHHRQLAKVLGVAQAQVESDQPAQ